MVQNIADRWKYDIVQANQLRMYIKHVYQMKKKNYTHLCNKNANNLICKRMRKVLKAFSTQVEYESLITSAGVYPKLMALLSYT